MRDPNRIPRILKKLEQLWIKYPDLRLAQLLVNMNDGYDNIFYLEDNILEKLIDEYPNNQLP